MPQETAENLRDLLVMKLQVLYFTEQEITKALPKMVEAVTDEDLKNTLQSHLKETEEQTKRLLEAFNQLDAQAEIVESDAVTGLIADAQWCIDNIKNPQVLDASLISAAQSVEHHEIAGYGSAATWAEQLGEIEVKNILGMILDEEKSADEKLNALAMAKINEQATDEVTSEESADEEKGILGRMIQSGI